MPTKAQTDFAFHQLGQVLRDLETDLRWKLDGSVRIPAEWHDIAQSREQPLKSKITLRVDQDVARFFRAMGQGHLTRMNAVLRAFMLARLAEVVKAEARYEMTPKEVEHLVRDEIFAVIRAQEAAKEAAEARLAGKAWRAFLCDDTRAILPAYGTFTGGLWAEDAALQGLMGPDARAILTLPDKCLAIPMPRPAGRRP